MTIATHELRLLGCYAENGVTELVVAADMIVRSKVFNHC